MKKFLMYLFGFILFFFILPAVCTIVPDKTEKVSVVENNEQNIQDENNTRIEEMSKEYLKYQKIKLLHKQTGEVEELNMDEYLYGVVAAEMPASYEKEALKAQAIVARTYTIYQAENSKKHENADVCDDYTCCQAWISKEERMAKWDSNEAEANWQKIVECVNETTGRIITYNGTSINAFFHSNSGGITESSLNIWGGIDYPYLKSVETVGEEGYDQYNSEVIISKEDLINKMKEKYSDFEIDFLQEDSIKILEYTSSNRVKTIKIGNKEIAGTEARTIFGLKSTNFAFETEGDNFKFCVKGYGHGVGMSQTGADSMAKLGANYEEIIKHFYTGVEIK